MTKDVFYGCQYLSPSLHITEIVLIDVTPPWVSFYL